MLNVMLFVALLFGAFYFLVKSADYLIIAASVLGRRVGFSRFIIGITIVAVGTSLPELAAALMGIFTTDNPAPFILGTVLGSNISNVLLVFSILLIFSNRFKASLKKEDIGILVISAILFALVIFMGQLNYLLGILFLVLFIAHMNITIKKSPKGDIIEEELEQEDRASQLSSPFLFWILVISLVVLNVAAKGVVVAIDNLGFILNIPLSYLTLTTVALATSLPEAVVTYRSAKRRDYDIAVGNVIGSNIANVLLIIGVSSLFGKIVFDRLDYMVGIVFLMFSTMYLVWVVKKDNVKPWYGIVSLMFYIVYIIVTFIS